MDSYIGSWGCVHEASYIAPKDQSAFEANLAAGVTMHCIGEENGFLVLNDMGTRYLTDPAGYWRRPTPDFVYGQKVFVPSKGVKAFVRSICWHHKEKCYFYHVVGEDGKKLKKRYYADDLEAI